MGSTGRFTLSLDCEGLWGMADQDAVVRAGLICRRSLEGAYSFVSRVLEESGIRATCAFVSSFAAEPDALTEQRPLFRELAAASPSWFRHVLPALDSGRLDGWTGHAASVALRAAGHEIGWHGATHLPLGDETPAQVVALETELAQRLFAVSGHHPTSIVFPRNQVGHLAALRQSGFDTYRASAKAVGLPHRVGALAREWDIRDTAVQARPFVRDGWRVSPAGNFLNWPSGARAFVPVSVTILRWRSLLRHAAAKGGYVHMWFHPHNLITAPAMCTSFEAILREAGELVRAGDLANVTMAEGASDAQELKEPAWT